MVDPHQKNENAHLVDVGIRGTSKIQMVDGQAYFTAMKFLSTSYNNEGVKFYLLIVLYINNAENEIPKILTATLSPPIFVDSRKSARDNQERKYSSFIEPFLVENLQKQFIKRENKRKNQNQIKIRNDFEGLFSYLTAPNIRHKVKHPVFIAIKFNNCAKLFFNSNLVPKTTTSNQMLIILQKKISKDHTSRRSSKSQCKIDDKMFILLIKQSTDSFKNKKVQQSIDPLDCNSLGIIYKEEQLPPFFQNTSNLGNISNAYKEQYSQLYLIAKSIINIQNSDENSDDQSESENQSNSQSSSQTPMPIKKRFHKKYESEPEQGDDEQKENSSNKKSENLNQNFQINQTDPNNKKFQIPLFPQTTKQNSEAMNLNNLLGLSHNQSNQMNPHNSNSILNTNLPTNNSNLGNNIQQILMNNMTLTNTLSNMKGGNLYSNNQQTNLLNMLAAGNNMGKGLNISQQSQQNELLNTLLGNSFNPIGGMNSINNLVGINSQLNNQIPNNQSINNLPQSNQKVGFSLVQQGQQSQPNQHQQNQQQHQQQQQQQIYQQQQQQFQQLQQDQQIGLNNNPQQTNILLLQQLAMYKDLLNQLTFQNQLGFNLNTILPGLGQGMQNLGQSGLNQGMQGLGQPGLGPGIGSLGNLGVGLGNGINGLNLNNGAFNQFGSLQNQISQQQNILKMMQQLQSQNSEKQPKQQEQ